MTKIVALLMMFLTACLPLEDDDGEDVLIVEEEVPGCAELCEDDPDPSWCTARCMDGIPR
jgi:hypothetical protein